MAILGRVFPPVVDLKGTELILDADADTTITADTDDRIDIKIAGADDFKFTANNFNVLSGSTLTIDSGATITNSGTANNFGTDPESAYAGVLQSNANFVDQVIFGPAVDGRAWNGLWNKASLFSSLMLATIEDEGSNTEINIWDLTEQSAGTISTTPLATVDLSAAATPTSIAASMGYLIVGSEDGIAIIDPHSGAWAERTVGWPRTLSTSTVPALTNNDVQDVAAGISSMAPLDPRTGGPLPVFACAYGTGADTVSLIKYDGKVWDFAGTIGPKVCGFVDDRMVTPRENSGNQVMISTHEIDAITTDDWAASAYAYDGNAQQFMLGANTAADFKNRDSVFADTTGLTIRRKDFLGNTQAMQGVSAEITRAYNTGFKINYTKGAWFANSKTADRSGSSNTLTETGSLTLAAAESGSEIQAVTGFSGSVYVARTATDSDYNALGNGSAYLSIWFKSSGNSADEDLLTIGASDSNPQLLIRLTPSGFIEGLDKGATATTQITGSDLLDNGAWHKVDFYRVSNVERYLYVDGVLTGSNTTNAGSLTDSGMRVAVGSNTNLGVQPASSSALALARLSTTIPTDTQIRQMYDAEKGMFVASAECLLQSGSTDAVLDVDIDPLTSKVIVTQTDAITVFDGLVVDSKPSVNSGNSEKGKLWGALRAEQNSANAYVTATAVDQRQVNEMVRGLANDMPAGVDLSKAKAAISFKGDGTEIYSSFNVKSITDGGAGTFTVTWGVPFAIDEEYYVTRSVIDNTQVMSLLLAGATNQDRTKVTVLNYTGADSGGSLSLADCELIQVIAFGQLENEDPASNGYSLL